jgi:uncharacterized protein (TIGR00251 family)
VSADRSKTRRPREFKITDAKSGTAFPVRVIPRASRNEVEGITGNALNVRVTAPPVGGAANKALVELLAKRLKVRKSQIEIVAGHTSQHKMISIVGLRPSEVEERLFGKR